MNESESNLIHEIKERIYLFWNENKRPYLISSLGSHFKSIKDIIGDKKTLEWIKEHLDVLDAYIYRDENRKEYVGLIPNGEDFKKDQVNKEKNNLSSRDATINFFIALGGLSKEDREKITIPVDVLTKLMGK
ncbi:hypothetical protein CWC46_21130 [Prodigiosinella confusarubida]|uniref:Uncharacterized protein n=1 Tax=Serratia sp. (strain ATCC 39006) TaxID=104623 RepID=A0A2I5TBZ3_SERS3|nr:hypothetical protein [Serratia sp. ATCC 39006]AUH02074.1 hypothetical protein CWC46_21130 [Serratia sp. ATCC 39006]AUH06395.1 hypothetical protein Ser39006_021125 [Serratia sp. ATCC 39006]